MTPGGAVVVGLFCAGIGVLVILAMLGVFGPAELLVWAFAVVMSVISCKRLQRG